MGCYEPNFAASTKEKSRNTRFLLSPQGNDTVLDVGCGDGYQISYFANSVCQVVGVDISKRKIKKAKRGVPKSDLVCASSSNLPFKPRIFDKILCLELLEHLEHPSKTINEIDLSLKKKGILIVSVPYREQIIQTRCVHCGKVTPLYGHLHSFDEQKISRILMSNYNLLKRELISTPASSYHLFAFLPTRLWKIVDTLSRALPGVRPYWIISKAEKTAYS